MTIPTESSTTEIYVGTGLVDTYAYAFLVNDETDLTVKIRNTIDEETTLVLNTDYTVTGVGNPNGGDVVLSSTLVLNYKLVAYRDMPYLQEIDLTNQEAFFLESMEDGLDNVTMLVQQLSAKAERGVYREETDDSEIPTFTEIADYATSAATSAASAAASALVVQNTWKSPATCKTTANITLSGEQTIDGVATSVSRVLVANQTDQKENGIYLSATGAWSRSVDADIATELNACIVPVSGGTLYHDTIWMEESVVSELGVDNVTFGRKDNGYVGLIALDIDGGTDIGEDLATTDLMIVDDGAGGTNRKAALSRFKTFIGNELGTVFIDTTYRRDLIWAIKGNSVAADRRTLLTPNILVVGINGSPYYLQTQSEIDLNTAANWDDSDYATPANRAGLDFYFYGCEPISGLTADIILSANSTYPDGYTADNSRKLGGFHCLCVSSGTISGHSLTGFLQGDIIPHSIWDLLHRAESENIGMRWEEKIGHWVDIYMASGTGVDTTSVYGATISDTRNWMNFVDDFAAVKKRMLWDWKFQIIASGSNEGTNIAGSADPVTTGGHSDTAGRRMISNGGDEDCCGALWQWLLDQSFRYDGDTWSYKDQTGGKGQLYTQGTYGDVKLLAGGGWDYASNCGSRGRYASSARWDAAANIGARGCARPRIVNL